MISIVTITYKEELPLLALQAKSIATHFKHDDIQEILIIINDMNEQACFKKTQTILDEYGPLKSRVKILTASEVFKTSPKPKSPIQLIKAAYTYFPTKFGGKYFGGWNGNPGWRIQQALKIMSAKFATGDYVLLLDAKNHFIRNTSASDYVSEGGKAKWRKAEAPESQKKWIKDSFERVGAEDPDLSKPFSTSITPFCCKTTILKEVCEYLENLLGPLNVFFTCNLKKDTEFQLIAAVITKLYGDLWSIFTSDLQAPMSVFHKTTPARMNEILTMAENEDYKVFSLHLIRAVNLEEAEKNRIIRLWQNAGLINSDSDAIQFFKDLKQA